MEKLGLDVLLELREDLLRVWLESRPPNLCSSTGGTRELFASSSLSSQLRVNLSKAMAGFDCAALRLVGAHSSVGHSNTNSGVA